MLTESSNFRYSEHVNKMSKYSFEGVGIMNFEEYIERKHYGRLFIRQTKQEATTIGNIIFCCTPVLSVSEKEIAQCYEPLTKYGFDVFAFDMYGTCRSDGKPSELSAQTILEDFETVVEYIRIRSNQPIFLFAGTGIGGIIGQAYASSSNRIRAFAQYGQVKYRDVSFCLKIPKPFITIVYRQLKGLGTIFPKLRINFPLPEYSGYNAEKEKLLYESFQKINPNFFKMNICFINSLFYFMWDQQSPISKSLDIPTMVVGAKHDRYFPMEYTQSYYEELMGEKRIFFIDDCHSSYLFHSETIAKHVSQWFLKFNQE